MLLALALLRHSISDGTTPENRVGASWQPLYHLTRALQFSWRALLASVLTGMGFKARTSRQGNPGTLQLQLLPPDHDWRGVCPVAGWKRHPGEKSKSIRAEVQL